MTILKQQLIVGGLRIIKNLVEDCQEEPEESEQPPLPEMRNNDQRKQWLREYKSWGLWYTDPHIGARYYKYDFNNGARLIAIRSRAKGRKLVGTNRTIFPASCRWTGTRKIWGRTEMDIPFEISQIPELRNRAG